MTNWTEERIAAYRIVRAWECGSRTLWRIWNMFPDPRRFCEERGRWRYPKLTDRQMDALLISLQTPVDPDLETLEREGIVFLLPTDTAFPVLLKHIPDPPAALFVRGIRNVDEFCISLVGTRSMTSYGQRCSEFLARELAMSAVTVVSGLAIGVDAACHRGCLDANGRTIAVLPSGVDDRSISPQTNLRLAKCIVASGGLLLSENAPGTPTLPYQFLHRNRLIAGLSDATVIIEADHDSGALVTAKLALEQGRDVLAVPGPIWSNASRGTNELIKNGAYPCTNLDDIWRTIGLRREQCIKNVCEARSQIPQTAEEQLILERLREPKSADELSRISNLSISEVSAILSMLEMKGRIISVSPRTYVRANGGQPPP